MISDNQELVARALANPQLAALIATGDWYLVGSRSLGLDDDLSDWDTVLITDQATEPVAPELLRSVFDVDLPVLDGVPDLDFHRRWRRAGDVELELLGPDQPPDRGAAGLAEAAFTWRHAVGLNIATGAGERYRAAIAGRFEDQRPQLARCAYAQFRRSRNEAVSCLARPDRAAQLLTAAEAVRQAARCWLLTAGQPHASDKWLLHQLSQHPAAAQLVELINVCLDPVCAAQARFQAWWELWQLVEAQVATGALIGRPGE